MLRWIRKQRNLTSFHFILARHHGTLAKRRNVTTSLKNGTMNSKHQVSREIFFLIYSINDLSDIKPSYMKGGPWIKSFGFSNSLCAWATQAITNHAPIGEYQLCFFPREEFRCPCRIYPIKSRCHILYNCRRFNKGWNPGRKTLFQLISFLEFNPNELAISLWL